MLELLVENKRWWGWVACGFYAVAKASDYHLWTLSAHHYPIFNDAVGTAWAFKNLYDYCA